MKKKKNADNNPHDDAVEVETTESNLHLALVQVEADEDGHTHTEEERGHHPRSPIVEDVSIDEEHDPGKRIPITRYDPNDQDRVRRRYIELGPCQPKNHDFKFRDISGYQRRFCPAWFMEFKWLEYSVDKDAAFCFVCYLFKDKTKCPGVDTFVEEGFRNWNLKSRLTRHVGAITSAHAEAQEKYDLFTTPKASIRESIASNTTLYKTLYKRRLTWSLECLRFLLRQGLAFRGHDESEESLNKGNFLELLNWLAGNFEEVNMVVLKNAPQNCKMTSPDIQHELINCCGQETTKLVIEDLDGDYFAILADESSDVYQNEQLAVCLRYVDKQGRAVVRFLGLAHVEDTTSLTLKSAIEKMLIKYNLSLSMVRGQGYDGASNMKGNANGPKKLIMDESPYAYYVHCFAHQLQLTLVAVAKESGDCTWFFQQLTYLLNVFGLSCKKIRMLRIAQAEELIDALDLQELETGTDDLSRALQKKDQDIVNAIELVDLTKYHLQCLRQDAGWKDFLEKGPNPGYATAAGTSR
ncbi:hypothetical protein U9M48_034312 [Paspalum notatum var. saurae]|uniref:TTF-type domain-containing protein n=1 Tax=Paspalum notatum var. saurae TaxID=547442 RepID=A0AAQ3X8S7_PASNO